MKTVNAQRTQYFLDLASILVGERVQADQRIQVKMPRAIVQELDRLFPDVDRSRLLTQLAAQIIAQELKFKDRGILREQVASEQKGLDDMLSYLEDRDAGAV